MTFARTHPPEPGVRKNRLNARKPLQEPGERAPYHAGRFRPRVPWRGVDEMETEGTLSSAWDRHPASEFAARSADEALAKMAADPHVNHVPLLIGGRGRDELHDFYANRFLNQIPP